MAARSKARKRAVDVLYEAELRGDDRLRVIRDRIDTAGLATIKAQMTRTAALARQVAAAAPHRAAATVPSAASTSPYAPG